MSAASMGALSHVFVELRAAIMAKDKVFKSGDKASKAKGIPNKHLHARTTFLYHAAAYLTLQTTSRDARDATSTTACAYPTTQKRSQHKGHSPLALQLGSDLHSVSRKGQLRLAVDLKRSMCKACHTILIPGRTATQLVENQSKDGKKPWADVLVIECKLCGGKKRFPIGAKRQLKKTERATTDGMEGVEQSVPMLPAGPKQALPSG